MLKSPFLEWLRGLLYAIAFIAVLLCFSSCTRAGWEAAATSPIDSTVRHQVASQLQARHIKFNGPVTLQIGGTGNTGTATDATKAKAPVAAAPHATATQTTTSAAGTPWWVFALVLAAGLAGGTWLGTQLGAVSWLAPLRRLL